MREDVRARIEALGLANVWAELNRWRELAVADAHSRGMGWREADEKTPDLKPILLEAFDATLSQEKGPTKAELRAEIRELDGSLEAVWDEYGRTLSTQEQGVEQRPKPCVCGAVAWRNERGWQFDHRPGCLDYRPLATDPPRDDHEDRADFLRGIGYLLRDEPDGEPEYDEGPGDWLIQRGVTCVVCPGCAFTFDEGHEDTDPENPHRYSCPNCGHGERTDSEGREPDYHVPVDDAGRPNWDRIDLVPAPYVDDDRSAWRGVYIGTPPTEDGEAQKVEGWAYPMDRRPRPTEWVFYPGDMPQERAGDERRATLVLLPTPPSPEGESER